MTDARKKVKSMFEQMGQPPSAQMVVGNLEITHTTTSTRTKAEPSTQLNLRVPVSAKHRVKVLAVRDRITAAEVVMRALALYEEKHGPAPEF